MLAAGGARGGPPAAPHKVLVVDDEPDLADLAQALLRYHGVLASVAYGAHEALRILKHDSAIDTVFSDMMMPGMTGLALAEAIGIDYPHVRVILTSGYAPPALLNRYNRPYPYVAKPYRIEQVLVLLE